ncbi:hypothetical protein C5167_047012 [Papaver somniferum]|uniref:Uncharacterized protein n=1 Tax=Papaver somniferum TaxID=3469 RepID=A0A4Y7LHP0_PAPSO|nr:putative protein TPRXL [Papaver somniferum]RZC84232.1 hypothetical protein C5167_047012 [Papaver somniferum]
MEGSGKKAGKSSSSHGKKNSSSTSQGKSSSSFSSDLFDNKKSSSSNPTSTSSSELFDSVFSTPSTIRGRDSSHSWNIKSDSQGDFKRANEGYSASSRDRNDKGADPCHLSSSIYYGCQDYQDVYNDSSNPRTYQPPLFKKKDGDEDDSTGTNLYSASRGNWWEGSLYY